MTAIAQPHGTVPVGDHAATGRELALCLVAGTLFGFVLTKAEAVSWFRIQEMFRFQSFHMYGLLFSAVAVAAASLALIRRLGLHALNGEPVTMPRKSFSGLGTRYWAGGSVFGVGWALTGACPGPLFTLVGAGVTVMSVGIVSALTGTWVYGYLRPKLPH